MENIYWNRKGKHQEKFDELCEFMPSSGKCDTVAGEMIRSANRLAYDFYNNGMGNNTSGAINFLRNKSVLDTETYKTIYEYTRGRIYRGRFDGDSLQVAIERMIDMTVEMIIHNPVLITMANVEDMFDYEEPEEYEDEDEDYYDDEDKDD
jgi:hypothetical protein